MKTAAPTASTSVSRLAIKVMLLNNLVENRDFHGMSFSLEAKALVEGSIFIHDQRRMTRATISDRRGLDIVEIVDRL